MSEARIGLYVLIFMFCQDILQGYSLELLRHTGLVSAYYIVPLGLEFGFMVYLTKQINGCFVNLFIAGAYASSVVNYAAGFVSGLLYDKGMIDRTAMQGAQQSLDSIEYSLAMMLIVLVVVKLAKSVYR